MTDNQPHTDTVNLSIEGMTCASCVTRVEKVLAREEGVTDVAVNLATNRARVRTDRAVPVEKLVDRVERAGYGAAEIAADAGYETEEEQTDRSMILALLLAGITLVLAMTPMLVPAVDRFMMPWRFEATLAQFVLTTILLAGPGRSFFVAAAKNARYLTADMNTLVAVGTGAAWIFSSVVLFFPDALPGVTLHEVYFETAAVVAALVLFGRHLEDRAKRRASDAIRALASLLPKMAHRVEEDGEIRDVETTAVQSGDLLVVRPGETIPADGHLEDGTTRVNEAMMTGESRPVDKQKDDPLVGGTVNLGDAIRMRVTGVGSETVLAGIVRIVDEAQSSKPPVQRLADRVAGIFVPIVLVVALGTFLGWLLIADASVAEALLPTVAVLVIACPCAMGLAVPTAIIAATGRGAERGILVRNAEALERSGAIDLLVFDKTGTLTLGTIGVGRLVRVDRGGEGDAEGTSTLDDNEILQLAASLEQLSEHPVARSIVRTAAERGLPLLQATEFVNEPGLGVRGVVDGRQVVVGQRSLMPDTPSADLGDYPVWIAVDGTTRLALDLDDQVRPEAASTIARLADLGLETMMLTGDAESTARRIASEIGIDRIRAGVSPKEKEEQIVILQQEGPDRTIGMIGDGVNDAPALARADVSIAMGGGTDVAASTADVTILADRLDRLPEFVELSRKTGRIIRQNLFWAFGYNTLGIPLAAAGLLDPMIAGAAMALSSVSVVTNSLRVKKISIFE